VRVDGAAYSILGKSSYSFISQQLNVSDANVTNRVMTPTQITLTAQAGPMRVNVTFFNPVEVRSRFFNPLNLYSLSPFSQGIGSGNQYPSHTSLSRRCRLIAQLIAWKFIPTLARVCEIVPGTITYLMRIVDWVPTTVSLSSDVMLWNVTSNDEAIYHTATYLQPVFFSENSSQAGWGTFYYATKAVSASYSFHLVAHRPWIQGNNVTYKISDVQSAISMFISNGVLDNNQGAASTNPISPKGMAFAISRDLGMIQATQDPVVFALGYTTDPAISYPAQSGIPAQQRRPYYKLKYADDEPLVTLRIFWSRNCADIFFQIVDFLNDFGNALKRAQQLDQKILRDAASVSDLLGDLVSLAVPQVFGSTQLTIGTDAIGRFNESDVMMFMKNIGGDVPK